MALTYTWRIDSITKKTIGELEDVVCDVHFTKLGTDEDGNIGQFSTHVLISTDDLSSFTPYMDLTKSQVLGWVQGAITESRHTTIDEQIQSQIDTIKNSETSTDVMPWDTE